MRKYDIDKVTSAKWPTVPLGTIAQFRNGLNYTKDNFGRGIKVINVKDFQNHLIALTENLDEINPDGIVREESLLREGDIVFVRSNGNRDLIGRSLFIEKVNEPISHSAFTIKLRFTSNDVVPKFYAYLFRSSLVRQTLSALGNGTNISNLNQSILSDLEVPFPPIGTQRRIAAILSAYDDLIENNTRRIQILDELARRIYEEWFVRFHFPGHRNVKMVESELGLIPQGWSAKRLGDIAQEVRRTVNPSDIEAETPYVGLEHIPRRLIALMDWSNAGSVQSTKHVFKTGNILFGKIRPYFHKVSVVPTDGVCSSDAIVIEAKNPEMFPFVLGTVSSDAFVQHATQTSNGVNMPRANWSGLLKYPVYIPTNELRQRLSDFIEPTLAQIRSLTFKVRNLRQTRDLLLPKLISGEKDVSNIHESLSDLP